MSRGIWVSDTEFVRFSEPAGGSSTKADMATHMATRLRAGDMSGMFGVLPNPDPILRRSGRQINVYRELMVDTMVKAGARRRRAAVVSMEHGFDRETTASPALVKNLEAVFADLPVKRLVKQLVDGAFYGYAVAEVIWGKVGGLVVPVDVVVKPAEWFGFDGTTDELVIREKGCVTGAAVPDRKFLIAGNNRSYANPYGEPDLASCFWPVAFRRGGLKFWVKFAEKYGMPWAVGKQPRSASQADADKLADKLDAMVQDAVAVIPDDASVELLQSSTTANADMFEQLLMYASREINITMLGNNQSVEMQSNKASAVAASGVEGVLRDGDADMVAEPLSLLALWITRVNWPSYACPKYEFWEQQDVDEKVASRDLKLTQSGVKFTKSYWMRQYDLQDGDIEEGTPAGASAGAPSRVSARGQAQPGAVDAADVNDGQPGQQAQFAEGDQADMTPDQAAIDEAIAALPKEAMEAAMEMMLAPALDAIGQAKTPEEVMVMLAEAFPKMDSTQLEDLLTRAFFVADVVGRSAVATEAKAG
jgi:phage gp29-like protein